MKKIRVFTCIFDTDVLESISCINDTGWAFNIFQYIVHWFVVFKYLSYTIYSICLRRCFSIDLHFNLINFVSIVGVRYKQVNFDLRYCIAKSFISCSNDDSLLNSWILSSNDLDNILNFLFRLSQINFSLNWIKRLILDDLSGLNHGSNSRVNRLETSCILLLDLFNNGLDSGLSFINLLIINQMVSCIILYDSRVYCLSWCLLNNMRSDWSWIILCTYWDCCGLYGFRFFLFQIFNHLLFWLLHWRVISFLLLFFWLFSDVLSYLLDHYLNINWVYYKYLWLDLWFSLFISHFILNFFASLFW